MPAKRLSSGKVYSHVYNCGVEKRNIFNDAQDYECFESFLKDYLTPPADPESVKKVFTVKGRSFKGTPHQPKNYHRKIELAAYSLMPNHFHLILDQKEKGSIESLIRSLCTRYSMYFNKKYQRTGSLFEGPYKSVQISNESQILSLINFIHHGGNEFSSFAEYSGKRYTSWLNINSILSSKNVNDPKLTTKLPKEIILENSAPHLERRDLATNQSEITKPASRIPEYTSLFATFLLLLGLGIRNISISSAKDVALAPTEAPLVLSESTVLSPTPIAKITLMVKSSDKSSVAIYSEPSNKSEKISEANDGETLEFASINSGWYGIKFADGSIGYIFSEYIEILETDE
jgi:putative transposase